MVACPCGACVFCLWQAVNAEKAAAEPEGGEEGEEEVPPAADEEPEEEGEDEGGQDGGVDLAFAWSAEDEAAAEAEAAKDRLRCQHSMHE